MMQKARVLALAGALMLAAAGVVWLLTRLGADRIGLTGTLTVRSGALTVLAPVGLWILASLVLTVVLNAGLRLFRGSRTQGDRSLVLTVGLRYAMIFLN